MNHALCRIEQTASVLRPMTRRRVDPDHTLMLRTCLPHSLVTVAVFSWLATSFNPYSLSFQWAYIVLAIAPGFALIAWRRFSLAAYGVTFEGAGRSLLAALPVAVVVAMVTVVLAALLSTPQSLSTYPLTVHTGGIVLLYAVHIVLQEFLARGCQVTLRAHVGTHSSVWIAGALFALFHVHHGTLVMVASAVLGVINGYVFARLPNLAGVCLVHLAAGLAAMYVGVL